MGCSLSKCLPDQQQQQQEDTLLRPSTAETSHHPPQKKHDLDESETSSDDDDDDSITTIVNNPPINKQLKPLSTVILGPHGSGKTTIFNLMKMADGRDFSPFERRKYAESMWAQSLRTVRILLDLCFEESKMDHPDRDLVQLFVEWMDGDKLNKEALVDFFATIFPPEDDQLFTNETRSLAVRNAAKLLRSTDLSVKAFKAKKLEVFVRQRPTKDTFVTAPLKEDKLNKDTIQLKLRQQMDGTYQSESEDLESIVDVVDFDEEWLSPALNNDFKTTRALLSSAMNILWSACPDQLKLMVRTNELKFGSNTSYFIKHINKFVSDEYLATNKEIIRGRVKDPNRQKVSMMVFNDNKLFVTDVDDSRSARKECVVKADQHVSCIVYVVNVASYDQPSEEFKKLTGLEEALLDFEDLVKSYWTRSKKYHLVLNKVDLLSLKCEYSSFKAFYPDYYGSDYSPNEIMHYIEDKFRDILKDDTLYVYRTSSIDMDMKSFANQISDAMFDSRE